MTHQAVTHHRHEKTRVKNYQRWEGLRDEYDEQRKIQRATRSLDIQRTGQQPWEDNDRPVLTLRDQQEANDARTSWRPQEAWNDDPVAQQRPRQSLDTSASYTFEPIHTTQQRPPEHRSMSLANGYNASNNSSPSLAPQSTGYHGVGPMRPTPTGSAWDDGLPRRLAVQRTNFDDFLQPTSRGVSRSTSLRQTSSAASSQHHLPSSNDTSPMPQSSSLHGSQVLEGKNINNPFEAGNRFEGRQQPSPPMQQQQESFATGLPASNNPFETGNRFESQQQQRPMVPQQTSYLGGVPAQQSSSNNPFEAGNRFDQPQQQSRPGSFEQSRTGNPFESYSGSGGPGSMAPIQEMKTPGNERDMSEWWK
jgi:hypothetical protein